MSTNYTTYGDISPRTELHARKRLLKRGQHLLVTERFGYFDPQPKHKSKTAKWRRYESLVRATSPLAEGVTPKGQKLRYTDVTATLEQYGDLVEITDVIQDTHEDPVLKEAANLGGEQAAETIEVLRVNFLKAGSNVYYANGATSRATVDSPPTRGDFRKIFRQMKKDKAKEIGKIIAATTKISTQAVEPAYFCMGHTDLKADIRGIPGFIPVAQYSNSMKALPGEVGSVEEFRIILTPLFEPWETSGASGSTYLTGGTSGTGDADVYPLIIVAANSYAITPLQGYKSAKTYVINPDKPSKSDPLGQIGYFGWKTWQAGAILNQLWVARLEACATANPS